VVQTVHVDDLAMAAVWAAEGRVPSGTVVNITEDQARSSPELMAAIRRLQGFPDAALRVRVPDRVVTLAGRIARIDAEVRSQPPDENGWPKPLA
jgi:nucleoside-diphosphate-sugar epimerase